MQLIFVICVLLLRIHDHLVVKSWTNVLKKKKGKVLFNDALDTFYGYMASDIW